MVDISNFGVINVEGRLDSLRAVGLRAELDAFVNSGRFFIVVDLSDVNFVDSSGLAALVYGFKLAERNNGSFSLIKPSHYEALRIFELTRFDRVFSFVDGLEIGG